jgi:hypothetical protein
MRTFHRLRLLNLLLTSTPDELSTSVLFALSKPVHPHQKHIGSRTYFLLTFGPIRTIAGLLI